MNWFVPRRPLSFPVAHHHRTATSVPLTASTSDPSPVNRTAPIMPSSPTSGSSSRGPAGPSSQRRTRDSQWLSGPAL